MPIFPFFGRGCGGAANRRGALRRTPTLRWRAASQSMSTASLLHILVKKLMRAGCNMARYFLAWPGFVRTFGLGIGFSGKLRLLP